MAWRRVVVTGMGTVNPIGHSVPEFWSALTEGRSGIRRIARFDPAPFTSQIGGEVQNWETVPDNCAHLVDPREARRMDRFAQFAVAAALDAAKDSGLDFSKLEPHRVGVVTGSGRLPTWPGPWRSWPPTPRATSPARC